MCRIDMHVHARNRTVIIDTVSMILQTFYQKYRILTAFESAKVQIMNLKMGKFHQKRSFSGTRLVECGWTWCFCFLFNCVCHPCDIFVTWKIARKVHLPEVSFLLISGILLYAYGIVGMRSNHSDPLLVRFFVLMPVLVLILALDLGRRRLKTDPK